MYMNENISSKQIIAMIIGFSFLIVLIIVGYYLSRGKNYDEVKINESVEFVLKKDSKYPGKDKNIPYLNIEGEDAQKINQEINSLDDQFASVSKNKIGFVFNKSDHILSLAIKMIYYDIHNRPKVDFKTYIINLNTKKSYTKEEIYKEYGVDDQIVKSSIENGFKEMYQDVVKKKYVDANECDYSCFLDWRGVTDYMSGVNLYIENKKLIAFKGFDTESVFGEEEYFESVDFKFEVRK